MPYLPLPSSLPPPRIPAQIGGFFVPEEEGQYSERNFFGIFSEKGLSTAILKKKILGNFLENWESLGIFLL